MKVNGRKTGSTIGLETSGEIEDNKLCAVVCAEAVYPVFLPSVTFLMFQIHYTVTETVG